MEIVKSRYGLDRSMEKLDHQTIRVIGESAFGRTSTNENGELSMFDFEGGPTFVVGNKIKYGGLFWEIVSLTKGKSNNLCECILKVKPIY